MKIIQISDLHLTSSPSDLYEGLDTLKRCEALLNHLKNEKADILVITGDIAAESENLFCYRFLRGQLGMFPYQWVVLPGNHDRGLLFREIFGSNAKTSFQIHENHDALPIAYFDNSLEEPAHLEELGDYLKKVNRPTCLFTHYPPIPVGHPSYDGKHALPWREQFLSALQKTASPLYVFFGHIHFGFEKTIGKIHFYSVPSATVPVIQGENFDLPDEKGLYFREIDFSGSDWKTFLHIV